MRKLVNFLLLVASALSAPADTFTADNAALVAGRVGSWNAISTSVKTITLGDQQCLIFNGPSLSFALTAGTNNNPSIMVSIDSGAATTYDLDPSTTSVTVASGLADAAHTCVLTYARAFTDSSGERWGGTRALTINSVTTASGKSISAYGMPANGSMIFFGDSHTEAAGLFVNAPYSIQNWTRLIAEHFSAKLIQVGFSGQGYEVGPAAGFPSFINTYDFFYSGVARVYPSDLKCVTLCEGANGTTTAADVKAMIEAVRASLIAGLGSSAGAAVYIKQLVAPGGVNRSAITTGFSDYTAAHPSDMKVGFIDTGSIGDALLADSSLSADHTHLSEAGCAAWAPTLYSYYADAMGSLPARARRGSGVFSQI